MTAGVLLAVAGVLFVIGERQAFIQMLAFLPALAGLLVGVATAGGAVWRCVRPGTPNAGRAANARPVVRRREEVGVPGPVAERRVEAVRAMAPVEAVTGPPPYRRQRPLLSRGELAFYRPLLDVVGPGVTVLAKVRLGDLVAVRPGAERWRHWSNQVNRKHVDFVLCAGPMLTPFLVIELDDRSHARRTGLGGTGWWTRRWPQPGGRSRGCGPSRRTTWRT